jgi:septum formation protein
MNASAHTLPVVLASRSPRRRELLERIGVRPECVPSGVDESIRSGEDARSHVQRLAIDKGARLAAARSDAVVIAADTVVAVDSRILNQPADTHDAAEMLRALSGRTHEVHTGCAVRWRGRTASGVESVRVTFRPLSDDEIARYVESGEPLDKAGAYGIQGAGAWLVRRVEGDYTAVVGLSLPLLHDLLANLGLRLGTGGVVAS